MQYLDGKLAAMLCNQAVVAVAAMSMLYGYGCCDAAHAFWLIDSVPTDC
jgi:hypothetical protein